MVAGPGGQRLKHGQGVAALQGQVEARGGKTGVKTTPPCTLPDRDAERDGRRPQPPTVGRGSIPDVEEEGQQLRGHATAAT